MKVSCTQVTSEGKNCNLETKIIWRQLNISRTRFFLDMRFSRGVHRHFVLSFSVKKSWGQWLRFPAKVKKPHFWPYFRKILNDPDFFRKIRLCHFVSFIVLQLHAKFWKDPMIGFREKLRTDGRTDMGQSIGPTSKVGGSKNRLVRLDTDTCVHN